MGKLKLTLDKKIDITNSNLSLGFGLFETIKIINNKPVFLREHLKRLENSLSFFKMNKLPSLTEIELFTETFLNSEKTVSKALKLIAVDDKLIFLLRSYREPENPVKISFSDRIRNSKDILLKHKTTSYFFNKLLMEESIEKEVYETLAFNEFGYLTEGGKTNLFVVKKGVIFTPKIENGLLPGIIRGKLIENEGVIEKNIDKSFLFESDEIFLTNSLIGILPVSNINNFNKKFDSQFSYKLIDKSNY